MNPSIMSTCVPCDAPLADDLADQFAVPTMPLADKLLARFGVWVVLSVRSAGGPGQLLEDHAGRWLETSRKSEYLSDASVKTYAYGMLRCSTALKVHDWLTVEGRKMMVYRSTPVAGLADTFEVYAEGHSAG